MIRAERERLAVRVALLLVWREVQRTRWEDISLGHYRANQIMARIRESVCKPRAEKSSRYSKRETDARAFGSKNPAFQKRVRGSRQMN